MSSGSITRYPKTLPFSIMYGSKYDSFKSVIQSLYLAGPIIFWISWPSNLVTKYADVFSGSLIESSVLIVSVSAVLIVSFLGEYNTKIFFFTFKRFFNVKSLWWNCNKTNHFFSKLSNRLWQNGFYFEWSFWRWIYRVFR